MKISGISVEHYRLPLDPPFEAAWDPKPRKEFLTTLVRVETDQGLTGIGAGDLMLGLAGHEELFLGRDPLDLERHSQVLDNLDFHYGRCWPLDLALWDLAGQAAGLPVYRLLGGRTDRLLAYASSGELVAPEIRAERALAVLEKGFKALKIRFHHPDPAEDIAVVEEVRRAVGERLTIMVDANQGWRMPWDAAPAWDFKRALKVAQALAELEVYWLEEPLPAWDFEGLARLRQAVPIRIAGGEMNRRWHDFREMAERGSLDVFQPDVTLCGGITLVKKIAELVQARGAWFSPHTWGNGIGLIANLHLAAAVGSCPFLELPHDPPGWTEERRDFVLAPECRPVIDREGYLVIPDRPGLGVILDKKALETYRVG